MGVLAEDPHLADALQAASKVLAYIQLRSLEEATVQVTLPQYRMLVILDGEQGPVRSGVVAARWGVDASTVTRNSDQLVRLGLVERGQDPTHRNAVTLDLTAKGREFVGNVREWRMAELLRICDRLSAGDQDCVIRGLYLLSGAAFADDALVDAPPHLTLF